MARVSDKPWLKAYDFGIYKLPETMKPYPSIAVGSYIDKSAAEFPERPAINYVDNVIIYSELKNLTDRMANALSCMGVKKGDRVASILINCPQFIISDFGILKSGAVHVPCSPLHKSEELVMELRDSGAETLICMDTSMPLIESIKDLTSLKNIIVTGAQDYTTSRREVKKFPATYEFLEIMDKYEPSAPQVKINPGEDLAELIFTGGTTGVPKGVMLTHASRVANTTHAAWAFGAFEQYLKGVGTWLIATPLYHQYGQANMHFAIYWAMEIFLLPDPRDIDTLMEILKKHQPLLCNCVPTQYSKLLAKGISNVTTTFTSTTAALPVEVSEKFKEATGVDIGENYGMSEMGGGTHLNLSISPLVEVKKRGSIGVPFPDTEVKIIDIETGREAAEDKEGELWVKGPQIMKGYWPNPGSGLVNGWLPSGDVVRMDDDGYFYITDRIKDMVNVSGMKVYTIVVERILYENPAVYEAAVIGVPDPERPGSERVKAFLVLKEGHEGKVNPEEVIKLCRDKLAPYAIPKYIEFVRELPKNPLGKVLKRQLREEEIKKARSNP